MGIRVHKVLGYGLTDLDKGYQADLRVNWDSSLLKYENEPTGADYFAWLEARRAAAGEKFSFSLDWAMLRHEEKFRAVSLRDCVAYEHEWGLPEVLVLRPVSKDDWYRFDDDIDYMTETYPWREDSQTSKVQVYRHGPFPFNGFYMDARDGRRLPDLVFPWWQLMNARDRDGDQESKAGALEVFALEMGFAGQQEAEANVVPEVPEEIRDLAEFGQLFTHAGTWRQLRPLLYTYWA